MTRTTQQPSSRYDHLLLAYSLNTLLWVSCPCFVLILLVLVFLSLSGFEQLFLLRAAGFLLPCYIMAWASVYSNVGGKDRFDEHWKIIRIKICKNASSNRQDNALLLFLWHQEAALAAAEVAFMIHGGVPQRRGLHFVVVPEQPPIPNQTPVWSFKAIDSPVRLLRQTNSQLGCMNVPYVCVTSLLLNVVTELSCTVLWLSFF